MSELPRLLIWGSSGHASVVADIVRCESRFAIVGLIDDADPRPRETPYGPVLGSRDLLPTLREQVGSILVAIGDNSARRRLAYHAWRLGFELPIAVHPRATVAAGVIIGPGTVVMAGAVINPGARIGNNAIVNTSASVDHDCILGNAVHLCPGVHLAGGVRIGNRTFVGIGSVVRERVCIGAGCTIGAGSVVVKDVPDGVLALGSPARVVRRLRPSAAER